MRPLLARERIVTSYNATGYLSTAQYEASPVAREALEQRVRGGVLARMRADSVLTGQADLALPGEWTQEVIRDDAGNITWTSWRFRVSVEVVTASLADLPDGTSEPML